MKPTSCSIYEFAAFIGRDRKTIGKWIREGMPAVDAGVQGMRASINTPAAIEWLLARERNKYNPELGSKNLAAERLRLLSEQADREALDNARRRGELIEYEDTEGCFLTVATILAGQLDGVAGRLTNELVNEPNSAVIRDRIFTEHRAIRASLAAGIQDFVDKCRQEVEQYQQDNPTAVV